MKRLMSMWIGVLTGILLFGCAKQTNDDGPAKETVYFETTVGTYNILGVAHDETYPNNPWAERKQAVKAILLQADNHPDIFGIQEVIMTAQMNEVTALMAGAGYDSYVSPKEISCRAIFWKSDSYSLVNAEDVEILPSATTGYITQRFATHVTLTHVATGQQVDVYNIHLPYRSDRQQIRNTAATTLSKQIRERYQIRQHPVILMGDFNNYYDTVVDGIQGAPRVFISNGFSDTYQGTTNRINPGYQTSNDLWNAVAERGPENGNSRIDYIMMYPAVRFGVTDYRIIINFVPGSDVNLQKPVPSDHHPVRSTLQVFYEE